MRTAHSGVRVVPAGLETQLDQLDRLQMMMLLALISMNVKHQPNVMQTQIVPIQPGRIIALVLVAGLETAVSALTSTNARGKRITIATITQRAEILLDRTSANATIPLRATGRTAKVRTCPHPQYDLHAAGV